MNIKIVILSLLIAIFLLPGCEQRAESMGSYRIVPVLADQGELPQYDTLLVNSVERRIRTPRHEHIFEVEFVDTSLMGRFTNARTNIVVASLESPGPAGEFIRNALSDEARRTIESGEDWIIAREDFWNLNQYTVLVTAPTAGDLQARLILNGDQIFSLINRSVNERVADWLYSEYFGETEKFALEDSIIESYGFGIRIPRGWDWEKGSGENDFLWLRKLEPERWVFVWSAPLDSNLDFSVNRWRHVRDSLCQIYYEGDSVSREQPPETTGTAIAGRPAVQIRGLWENSEKSLGGPLVSYVLSDPDTRRIFIVDGAVFAPVIRKEPFLRHVEIVCRSFRPNPKEFLRERAQRED